MAELTREHLAAMAQARSGGEDTSEDRDTGGGAVEFVYPETEDIPEVLRGKSPQEAARMFSTLQQAASGMAMQVRAMQEARAAQEQALLAQQQAVQLQSQSQDVSGGEGGDEEGVKASDVDRRLDALLAEKAGPFVEQMFRNQAVAALQMASERLPYFGVLQQEIIAEAQKYTVDQLANPQAWKVLHDMVAARHVDELAEMKAREMQAGDNRRGGLPPASAPGRAGGGGGSGKTRKVQLSAEEKAMADGLGITYKEWAEWKALREKGEG
jgi:NADH dehydrogenase/NADH:ubiquinone oxidoreductase subunit G